MAELSFNELSRVSGGRNGGTYIRYTLAAGDSISALAEKYHTTVDVLLKINNIRNPDRIRTGDKILIPVK